MYLLSKNYFLVEVINLLIRLNETKFLPRNTKNTVNVNGVNKLNTNTHTHTHTHTHTPTLREREHWKGLQKKFESSNPFPPL